MPRRRPCSTDHATHLPRGCILLLQLLLAIDVYVSGEALCRMPHKRPVVLLWPPRSARMTWLLLLLFTQPFTFFITLQLLLSAGTMPMQLRELGSRNLGYRRGAFCPAVLISTMGTVNTKTQPVHIALFDVAVCVFELAGRVGAMPCACKVTAHWHSLLIQLVQEPTGVPPHAQPFHPIRAHRHSPIFLVAFGTGLLCLRRLRLLLLW